jgi:hypothetical protein
VVGLDLNQTSACCPTGRVTAVSGRWRRQSKSFAEEDVAGEGAGGGPARVGFVGAQALVIMGAIARIRPIARNAKPLPINFVYMP